jgi:hypothetical protein
MTTRRYFAQKKIIHECDKIEFISPHITYPITSTDNTSPMLLAFDGDGIARKRTVASIGGGLGGLDVFGTSATANTSAATLTGDILRLEPANATYPGGISVGDQTLPLGTKTFQGDVKTLKRFRTDATVDANTGVIEFEATDANKRARIHNYSSLPAYSGNFFAGESAGNFDLTGTLNLGMGKEAGLALTSGNSNTLLNTGASVTTSVGTTLIGGAGSLLEDSDYSIMGGIECCQNLQRDVGRNVVFGYRALKNYTAEAGIVSGSGNTVFGSEAGSNLSANALLDNTILLGQRCSQGAADLIIRNSNAQGYQTSFNVTAEADDCLILAARSGGPPDSTATRVNETWIGNFNAGGTPTTYINGILNATEKYAGVPSGYLSISDKQQITSIPEYPGAGFFSQGTDTFSFVNNTSGNVVPFDVADMPANDYIHRTGNTLVVDVAGIWHFTFRYHSGTHQVNLLATWRVNGVNTDSHSHYLGKQILGMENEPNFTFIRELAAGDIVDFVFGGNTDSGAGTIDGNSSGAINCLYMRPLPF